MLVTANLLSYPSKLKNRKEKKVLLNEQSLQNQLHVTFM